jgi:hypothetical protein
MVDDFLIGHVLTRSRLAIAKCAAQTQRRPRVAFYWLGAAPGATDRKTPLADSPRAMQASLDMIVAACTMMRHDQQGRDH